MTKYSILNTFFVFCKILNLEIEQPKRPRDLQHSTLTLTGLDRRLESSDPINRQVISSPIPNMIVATVVFKLLLRKTSKVVSL